MIQILGLRSYFDQKAQKERRHDAFFDKKWRAPSVSELFANLETYLQPIPDRERWNLYYTAFYGGQHKRQFASQDIMAYDIDNIDVEKLEEYPSVLCAVLGVERELTGIVFSGNGLQIIVGLQAPFTSVEYFDRHRNHYRAICLKMDAALGAAGLPGNADPTVFEAARLLRLPGTINRKPDKPERMARLMNSVVAPQAHDIVAVSGLPPEGQALTSEEMRSFPRPDVPAILTECLFLKHCREHAAEVDEPELYAALSIVGRLPEAQKLAVEMFEPRFGKRNHGGSAADLEEKMTQAVTCSGPRTCENINNTWGGCTPCPHFQKVKSPICIKGPDYIRTQDTGFHDCVVNADGKVSRKPNYEDLRLFFAKDPGYVMLGSSNICYQWKGTHYVELEDAYLNSFAQDHFNPTACSQMRREFREIVQAKHLHDHDWFIDTTRRQINFQNGVLSLDDSSFSPHSRQRGFRYVLSYGYEPNADCPRFRQFLDEVTVGDATLQELLLEFAGYALSSDACWLHSALVLLGEGSNGKSTFMNVLRALAGKDNYASLNLSELRTEYNRHYLDGKLFNMSEETPSRALMESSIFKNLVSGGETQVRQIYKKPYMMRNRAKLIFACNTLPGSIDTTEGFFRRFLIVPFKANFTEANVDPFIEDKLKTELPGIFNLAMQGYRRLLANKTFTKSAQVKGEMDIYRREVDTVMSWLEENVVVKPREDEAAVTVIHDMYTAYSQDMEKLNVEPVNGIAFGKQLAKKIPEYDKRVFKKRVGEKVCRALRGVSRLTSVEGERF